MEKKDLKFSIYQLIINGGTQFNLETFLEIKNDTETHDINHRTGGKETLSIKTIKREDFEDKFVGLYFNEGTKYPYSPKVVGPDLAERNNPRSPEEIELDEQFFVLIDFEKQRVFLSEHRKKNKFAFWLREKIKKDVVIKSLIEEKEFIDKMQSVNKICFSVAPNLFNSGNEDILSNNLVKDVFGFGAKRAELEFDYDEGSLTDKIKRKISLLVEKRSSFEKIVVIGRSEENIESIFDLNEVVSKVAIIIRTNSESKLLDSNAVFNALIDKVKQI